MPTTIVIDGVTLTLKKYPEFAAGNPTATDITLFSDPVNGDLFKTTMDNLIANILHVDGATITGDGSSGSPLVSSGGGATASEGLIAVASDVRLGDTSAPGAIFTAERFINADTFTLFITGVRPSTSPVVQIDNTSTFGTAFRATSDVGRAVDATTNGGYAVRGFSSAGGVGISGESVSSFGMEARSTSNFAGYLSNINAATNTIEAILCVNRISGAAANGLGASILFQVSTDSDNRISNEFTSEWVDVTDATRRSKFKIVGVNSAASVDMVTLGAEGYMLIQNISATAASAITPSDGMIAYVNSTNGTFTAIGFWGYVNGAWTQL